MSIGAFVDKGHQPTMREVFAAVGSTRPLWESLNEFIAANYRTQHEFKFYGKNYGWAIRFRKAGKALVSLYPGAEYFTVQIILGKAQATKALTLGLRKRVRRTIEEAHEFPEGRWLFIRVESKKDLDDIKQLIAVKSPPLKKLHEA